MAGGWQETWKLEMRLDTITDESERPSEDEHYWRILRKIAKNWARWNAAYIATLHRAKNGR